MRAARVLGRNRGFTLVAVLTLALGIGANTAIFSVVNGVLLKPLAFPDGERIVAIQTRATDTRKLGRRVTGGDWMDLRGSVDAFEASSVHYGGEVGVQLGTKAEFTGTQFVTPGFFQVFGLRTAAGRVLAESDEKKAAVVTAGFAERNFGTPAAALGKPVTVENRSYEIVGVLAPGAVYPPKTNVFLADDKDPKNQNRTAYNYFAVAKLRAGLGPEAVAAQLDTVAKRLSRAHPDSNANKAFAAVPLGEAMTKTAQSTLLLLLAAVSLVFLISCANVANLLLARSAGRTREMALRAALGAGRGQIVRQLMAESVLLALIGGVLGAGLANLGVDALLALAPENLPRLDEVRVDGTVLAFAMGVSLLASLLFGLVPAWHASKTDLNECLKQGSRSLTGGRTRLKDALVVAEIALSVVLVAGGGLLFRSFLELNRTDLGFRPEGLLVMEAHRPADTLDQAVAATLDFERLYPALKALPGVTGVAGAMGLPMGRYGSNGGYIVEGREVQKDLNRLPQAGFRLASPGYFETMGIALKRGREFREQDRYETEFVAVISESMAREAFPNDDPIGKRLQCGLDSPKWMTIVGIVGDTRQDSPGAAPGPELYMPLKQHPFYANEVQVILRTAVPPETLQTPVERIVRDGYPNMATRFSTMQRMYSESLAAPRFRTVLVLVFGAVALLLAMAGVYGVVSYLVSLRVPELGLRMALGAAGSDVMKMVVGHSLRLGLIGLVTGGVLSLAAGRLIESMLFGTSPADAGTYIGTTAVVLAVTSLAALLPARRAARIDPLTALRQE